LTFAFYSLYCDCSGFAINTMAITKRQRQVYDYISDFVQKHGYSPSFEEIGKGMRLSSLATVHKHVSNLEKKAC
jgi:SOS-response transcriptional repressors (RecA-mediated autopeptidases)